MLNRIIVPVFEFNENNIIKPNPVFHRSWDHLHSRCIEYPYCASKISEEDQKILDIGAAKADRAWIAWLEELPMQIHSLDYDASAEESDKIQSICSDVRATPYPDDYFDVVTAVSVIEHIGLTDPQVKKWAKPYVDENGDLEAVKEIARILKPGGKLLMTVPFGKQAGLILNKQARSYDIYSIKKFDTVLQLRELEIFEYSSTDLVPRSIKQRIRRSLVRAMISISRQFLGMNLHETGLVTWRKITPDECRAKNLWHIDAVACGLWEKNI